MMYPPLEKDHKVLGKDYCPGYTDSYGKWNTGFPCPPMLPEASTIHCCGTSDHKYCCTGQLSSTGNSIQDTVVEMETEMEITTDYNDHLAPPLLPTLDIGRNSYVAAVICGLVAVTVLMTLVSCFYCSCCILYKKRRAQLPGGLYRIPASSTTCGLINSANGSAGNATTPVTTPLNQLFTSECWNSSNNPPQGQLIRTNPPMPEPPSGLRAHVNPILLNGNANGSNSNNHNINATSLSSTAAAVLPSASRFQQQQPLQGSSTTSRTSGNNVSRIHRQLSLLHQQNPNLLRSICNNSHNNHSSNNRQSYSIHNIPTIYNTTWRANNNNNGVGTVSSIISSVSSSGSSTNSLPPPYFLEQYRIRNRVRQPRNLPPATLLPSYNEIQRQSQEQQGRRQLNQNQYENDNTRQPHHQQPLALTTSTMNDLSAPPRRSRDRERRHNNSGPEVSTSSSNSGGQQIILISNVPPSPTMRSDQCQSEREPTGDKILNTSLSVQRRLSDAKRLRDQDLQLQDIRKMSSPTVGRSRIKSHSMENVSSSLVIKSGGTSPINAEMRVNEEAHAS